MISSHSSVGSRDYMERVRSGVERDAACRSGYDSQHSERFVGTIGCLSGLSVNFSCTRREQRTHRFRSFMGGEDWQGAEAMPLYIQMRDLFCAWPEPN